MTNKSEPGVGSEHGRKNATAASAVSSANSVDADAISA